MSRRTAIVLQTCKSDQKTGQTMDMQTNRIIIRHLFLFCRMCPALLPFIIKPKHELSCGHFRTLVIMLWEYWLHSLYNFIIHCGIKTNSNYAQFHSLRLFFLALMNNIKKWTPQFLQNGMYPSKDSYQPEEPA